MSLLSDRDIRNAIRSGDLGLDPFREDQLNPSSYDLTLDSHIRVVIPARLPIDTRDVQAGGEYTYKATISSEVGFELAPGMCALGSTVERITLPMDLASRVEGKSSLGRLFLAVHVTAGFFDPGWDGEGTLEIVNHMPRPIRIWPGMRIAQMAFFRMVSGPEVGYGSKGHYQGQIGATESRYRIPERCADAVRG